MHVGTIINKMRTDKRMTLLELSEKSGVALATLSRIENGRMTGTLESHMKIAESLETSLPEMYKDLVSSKKQVEMRARSAATDVFVHDRNATSEILVSKTVARRMLPLLIKISKGGSTHREETKSGVDKFIYVLDGKVEASVGENTYDLVKGDTLYFESSLPHQFKNTGASESRLICVVSPTI